VSFVVGIILLATVLLACDPASYVLARNSSATTVLIRVARGTKVETYTITPGFDGVVTGKIGESVDASVDVLQQDCSVIKSIGYVDQRVARIEFGADSAVTISSAGTPSPELERAPKSQHACEGTNAPRSSKAVHRHEVSPPVGSGGSWNTTF